MASGNGVAPGDFAESRDTPFDTVRHVVWPTPEAVD